MAASNRRQVRETVGGYLKQNPNAILEEIGCLLGVSRQRACVLLQMAGITTRRQRSTQLLTDKELEILSYIDKDSSNKQIAEDFGSSYRTIKNRVSVIIAKLGANDRKHAVALAREKGFLPLDNFD